MKKKYEKSMFFPFKIMFLKKIKRIPIKRKNRLTKIGSKFWKETIVNMDAIKKNKTEINN